MTTTLEKIRRINKLLQKTAGQPVRFSEMAKVLSEVIRCNAYVVSRKGKVLGHALLDEGSGVVHVDHLQPEKFPSGFNEALLRIHETTVNFSPDAEYKGVYLGDLTTVVPVIGGGERIGTLLLVRFEERMSDDDLILAETGATVLGMEILRAKAEQSEFEARKKAAVHIALGTLSYSEMEAVQHIFEALAGNEGLLVASKIADRVGITRSVIVNALRKFESAGVIEARSLGMKGTHIRVLNDHLIDELKKVRA